MKKVLVAALLCTVSVFAAWDKFPVIEDGKGEAKFEFYKSRQAYDPGMGFDFKIRYSPLAKLELMSVWDIESNYVLGARYQVIPVLSAGVDIAFPIESPVWSFTPNIQFSMPLSEALVLGSNVEFTIPTENSETEYKDFMSLVAGVELDVTLGQSTIWVGFDFETGIGEDSAKNKAGDSGRGAKMSPAIGYLAAVGNLTLGTSVALDFGEKSGNDPFNTTIGLDASIKF
jgi:hypothetical protein